MQPGWKAAGSAAHEGKGEWMARIGVSHGGARERGNRCTKRRVCCWHAGQHGAGNEAGVLGDEALAGEGAAGAVTAVACVVALWLSSNWRARSSWWRRLGLSKP